MVTQIKAEQCFRKTVVPVPVRKLVGEQGLSISRFRSIVLRGRSAEADPSQRGSHITTPRWPTGLMDCKSFSLSSRGDHCCQMKLALRLYLWVLVPN